jgi:hypothetical protein
LFKNFNEYLVPADRFADLKMSEGISLAVASDCDTYPGEEFGTQEPSDFTGISPVPDF